jgi:hypothetical protein
VSRPAPSGADQIDAQHQATDLAVRRSVLILESEMERRAFLASLASVVGAAASNGPAPRRVTPPSPGHLQLHPGSPPPGAVDDRVLWDVTREQPSAAFLVAQGGHGLGKGSGVDGPVGCSASAAWRDLAVVEYRPVGGGRHLQRRELRRTGDATPAAAGQRISQPSGGRAVLGQSPALLASGRPGCGCCSRWGSPLEPVPVEVGDRFPVNFYAGFYQQPGRDERPCTWQVIRVLGFDKGLRQ